MKYVYVLVSDESDYYYEQTLLSINSLRMQIPNAYISLLVDSETEKNLKGKRNLIINLINELKSIVIIDFYEKKARSRYLKTSVRQNLSGDFVFIDSDTVIAKDISVLENIDIFLGAVLNEHTTLSDLKNYNPIYYDEMQALDIKLNFTSTINSNTYFNSGLILCKDCTLGNTFYNEWHSLWLNGYKLNNVTDQQAFNQANYNLDNVIKELGGEWNCQILADGGIRYLHTANIIHYFNSMKEENPYLLGSYNVLEKIKRTGFIDQDTLDMLKDPKSLFSKNTRLKVINKNLRKFNKSITYIIVFYVFNTKFGEIIEILLYILYKKIVKPLKNFFKSF